MFFRTQLLVSALLAITSVLGAPGAKRDENPCEMFSNGYTNLSGFRVIAHKPNNIDDLWEIVLNRTGTEAAGWSSTFTVGDWNGEKGSLVPETFDMVNSGVTAAAPDRSVAVEVKDNAVPYFVSTGRSQPTPAPVWCAIPNDDITGDALNYDFLAANAAYDEWSLCQEKDTNSVRVAFKADPNQSNSGFDSHSCFPVYLRIVPA